MKILKFCRIVPVLFILTSSLAFGQRSTTWVSGTGDDTNPCVRTAPCKTWAAALAQTGGGGEIDALDPGSYGAVTITKSITLDGGGGQVALTVALSVSGIVVAAGSTDVVVLRNLRLDGLLNSGEAGNNGIRFISGKMLIIENCDISGFSNNGIDIANNQNSQVIIKNTTITDNAAVGVRAQTSAGMVGVTIDHSYFSGNGFGVWADNNSKITVTNSVAGGNGGIGFMSQATTVGQTAVMALSQDISSNNGVGMQVGGGAGTSILHYGGMTVFNNLAGLVNGGNGTSHSFQNSSNLDGGTPNGTNDSPTN
jgi:hypothetical protein